MMPVPRRKPIADINVVPYIDVMLVLLVIFMITTPLLTQGVAVELPRAHAKAITRKTRQPLIVTVDAKGEYFLNVAEHPKKALGPQALVTRVAAEVYMAHQAGQQAIVFVKGDRRVDYGDVMAAMVLLQHAGVSHIGLLTHDDQPMNLRQRLLPQGMRP